MKKTLGYMGHPVKPAAIDETRKRVGCAYRQDGSQLVFATFGESSTMEGGISIDLEFLVPEVVHVAKRDGLDGSASSAAREFWRQKQRQNDAEQTTKDSKWILLVGEPDEAARAADDY